MKIKILDKPTINFFSYDFYWIVYAWGTKV